MLKNILKITLRNLARRKIYSFINILGLSVGLASCLIIFLFVKNEVSYDRFNLKSENIYRIVRDATVSNQQFTLARINYSFADLVSENIPGVQKVTRVGRFSGFMSTEDYEKEFEESEGILTDPGFFEVFDVNFVNGSSEQPLAAPNQMILTQSAATKYFGDKNPIGETLTRNRGEQVFEVTGVIEDWPENSHMNFNMLISISSTRNWYGESMFTHWGNVWVFTYALVNESLQQETLDAELNRVAYEFGPDGLADLGVRFFTQPLETIHLDSSLRGEMQTNGSRLYVTIFSAIGILVLVIACFNFINLSTARASWRAKEVGLRKVVGAERKLIIFQFLGESLFVTFFSFLLAIILSLLVIPSFNTYSGKVLDLTTLLNPLTIALIFLSLVFVGVLAGSFPAFLLSSFKPVNVLKGNTSVGNSKMADRLRKSLVVLQFSISICLVVASLTIYYQLEFAKNKKLGYDKENVVILELYNGKIREDIDPLKQSLARLSGISSVSSTSDTPPGGLNSWWLDGKGEMSSLHELLPVLVVDHDFVKTMKLNVVDGRDFDRNISTDEESGLILNEAAVKYLGLENPVGTPFNLQNGLKEVNVIGVVEDFHFESIHQEISPLMIFLHPSWLDNVIVRIQPGNYEETLAQIEESWNSVVPDWSMRYHFLDDDFDQAYKEEQKLGQLIFSFSGLALFIGILGLFGLANYVAEQKTKEIGIRKVMGANLNHVVWLQYKSFVSLLLVAFVISIPTAIYFLSDWLNQFAYRIDLNWWLFVLGGVFTFVISMGTISYQSIKAAMRNPVDSLRNE